MKVRHLARRLPALLLAAVVGAASPTLSAADTAYKVGFINSLSGPYASLGVSYAKGFKAGYALQQDIGGHKIEVISIDDRSDPTAAVQAMRKLVTEDHVDVILGSSNTANDTAMATEARKLKVPMIALAPIMLGGDKATWTITVPQPIPLMVDIVVKRMKADGVKTLGTIAFSDASGDLFTAAVKKAAGAEGIEVVADERYDTSASSVTGQITQILRKHPDAVMNLGAGSPGALPMLALAQQRYQGRVYGDPPLLSDSFVRLAGAAGNGLVVSAGAGVVAEQLPESNPIRAVALKFDEMFRKANHEAPTDAFTSYAYDGWLLFLNAAERVPKNLSPGTPEFRAALRDALYSTKELVGAQGIYNFHPGDTFGVDQRAMVLVKLENGKWIYSP
ncbi:MAG TPA: ABC transporter substrate-binding protein [Nevskiaceae bacterium]